MDIKLSVPRKKYIIEKLIATQNCDIMEFILEDVLKHSINPGSLAIDGGANAGRHTRHMTQSVGSNGKIVAVEPLPNLKNYLELAFSIYPQFQFLPVALYNVSGQEMEFTHVKNRNTVSSLKVSDLYKGKYDEEVVKVKTMTIDDITKDSPLPCTAIKLDLEGAEYLAVQGASETIMAHRPIFAIEDGKEAPARLFGVDLRAWFNSWKQESYSLISVFGEKLATYEDYISYNPWYTFAVPDEKMDIQEVIIDSFNRRISQYI